MNARFWSLLLLAAMWPLSLAAEETAPNTLSAEEMKEGWKLLFDGKSLDGWRRFKQQDANGWEVREGTLALVKPGSGDIMTAEEYGNFVFSVEWKFEKGNNSGIVYRVGEEGGQTYTTGPEMQVMTHSADKKQLGKNDGGSLYDMYPPASNALKPAGEWNQYTIIARGRHIEHWVNCVKVVECDMDSDDWKAKLAASKWKGNKLFASRDAGFIALQDHGALIAFRNIKLKKLAD